MVLRGSLPTRFRRRTEASYRLPLAEDTGREFASLDALHARLSSEAPRAVQFYYALPRTGTDVYRASIVHEKGSYYKQDNRFFDPYDLQEPANTPKPLPPTR